jgi:hypothetical protein
MNQKIRQLIIWLSCISIIVPIISDLIYMNKIKAEEYAFGYFLIQVSNIAFAFLMFIIFFFIIIKIAFHYFIKYSHPTLDLKIKKKKK